MIRESDFWGRANYLTAGAGTHSLPLGYRVHQINPTAAGVVITIPAPAKVGNGDIQGSDVYIIKNVGADQITLEGEAASPKVSTILKTNEVFLVCYNKITGVVEFFAYTPWPGSPPRQEHWRGVLQGGGGSGAQTNGTRLMTHPGEVWSAGPADVNRAEGGGVGFRGDFFLATNRTGLNTIRRWNGTTWAALPSGGTLGSTRTNGLAGTLREDLFFFGGSNRDVDKVSPGGGYAVASMSKTPTTRTFACAVSVARFMRVLLMRGTAAGQPVWGYHGPSDTFETLEAASSTDRRSCAGMGRDGKAFVVGGRGNADNNAKDLCDSYNSTTRAWTTEAVLPAARYEGASFVIGQNGYYIGGVNSGGAAVGDVYRMSQAGWATGTGIGGGDSHFANQGAGAR